MYALASRTLALASLLVLTLTGTAAAVDLFSPPLTAQSGEIITCSITNVKTTGNITVDWAAIVGPSGNGLSQASNTCASLSNFELPPQQTCSSTSTAEDEAHCWFRVSNSTVRAAITIKDATTGTILSALPATN